MIQFLSRAFLIPLTVDIMLKTVSSIHYTMRGGINYGTLVRSRNYISNLS